MKALLSSTLVLIFLFCAATSVFARTPQSFRVLQSDFLLQTSAGKNLDEIITIENLTSEKQLIEVSFAGYKLPDHHLIDPVFLSKHSIDFVTIAAKNSLEIEGYASDNLSISFRSPETYPAGDYYGTLSLTNGSEVQKVNFTVRILGQIRENLEIKEVKNSSNYLILKIANNGTISEYFSANGTINRFFGKDISLTSPQIIIKSGEIVDVKLDHGKLLPGFFQSQVTLQYGAKQISVTKLFSFWVNLEFFIVSLITLIISFLLYFVFKRKRS